MAYLVPWWILEWIVPWPFVRHEMCMSFTFSMSNETVDVATCDSHSRRKKKHSWNIQMRPSDNVMILTQVTWPTKKGTSLHFPSVETVRLGTNEQLDEQCNQHNIVYSVCIMQSTFVVKMVKWCKYPVCFYVGCSFYFCYLHSYLLVVCPEHFFLSFFFCMFREPIRWSIVSLCTFCSFYCRHFRLEYIRVYVGRMQISCHKLLNLTKSGVSEWR